MHSEDQNEYRRSIRKGAATVAIWQLQFGRPRWRRGLEHALRRTPKGAS